MLHTKELNVELEEEKTKKTKQKGIRLNERMHTQMETHSKPMEKEKEGGIDD